MTTTATASPLIRPGDIRVETWSLTSGGFIHRVPTGVRVHHLPTDLVIEYNGERSQHRNRQIALEQLEAKLKELDWSPDAAPAEPQDLNSRLARALANELRRRVVTSLPLKGALMKELGLETLEDVGVWMAEASREFVAAAQEFIASQPEPEARTDDGAWRGTVERLVAAKDRVDDALRAKVDADVRTAPAAEQRHVAAVVELDAEFSRARGLLSPLPCPVEPDGSDQSELQALAKNPDASIRAFGAEWSGRCAASALVALAQKDGHPALSPVDLRGIDAGTAAEWVQIPGAQTAQLVQVSDVPRLVGRILGTRRFPSLQPSTSPYHEVEGRYEASGRPGVIVSGDLRARNVGVEAQIEISITDHYTRSNRRSSSYFGLQLKQPAARALALAICPELVLPYISPDRIDEASANG